MAAVESLDADVEAATGRLTSLNMDAQHARCGEGTAITQQKAQVPAALDQSRFQHRVSIGRALQLTGYRSRAVIGVTRYADCPPAQTLDPVVPVPGLDIDEGSRRQ